MGRIKSAVKTGKQGYDKYKKIEEKIDKVKGLYQTAKNLYHEETRMAELITQGYAKLQGIANVSPAATMYLKWHEEHINRLTQVVKSRKVTDMAMDSFRTSVTMSNNLVKQKNLLKSKYWYVFEMTDGDGRLSNRVDKVQELRDYYTYAEHSKDYYELLRTKDQWPEEDRAYLQAAVNIYPHELATRRRIAAEKIVQVTGEVTAAYFAFCRDYQQLRANAKACSSKLKSLLKANVSDWKNVDKVLGYGAAQRLMEEAFGNKDRKSSEAIYHFVWGNPLNSQAITDAQGAAKLLGRLAQGWLRWCRLVKTQDHTEEY